MATIKETAQAYEPKQTKNVADLEAVSIEQKIQTEVRKNRDGDEYTISFIVIEGEEHRVPNSVLEQLKTILMEKPVKTFKVTKTGEGINTKYTVIVLE